MVGNIFGGDSLPFKNVSNAPNCATVAVVLNARFIGLQTYKFLNFSVVKYFTGDIVVIITKI